MGEKEIPGIVNKPQFDTGILHVGRGVHVKTETEYLFNNKREIDADGVIKEATPLYLGIIYVEATKEERGDKEYIEVPIEKVINEKVKIIPTDYDF